MLMSESGWDALVKEAETRSMKANIFMKNADESRDTATDTRQPNIHFSALERCFLEWELD